MLLDTIVPVSSEENSRMAESNSQDADFKQGFEDGTAGKAPRSRDWNYLGGWIKGAENPIESPQYKRGFRDGDEGSPPSDLSRIYVCGYESGRRKYLEGLDDEKRFQHPLVKIVLDRVLDRLSLK